MTDPNIFPETHRAADLLRQFCDLSGKNKRSLSPAVQSYFDKDILTIAEFLAPLGEVLIKPVQARTIGDFLSSTIGKRSMATGQPQTMREFLARIS